jgi:hypothetical protein
MTDCLALLQEQLRRRRRVLLVTYQSHLIASVSALEAAGLNRRVDVLAIEQWLNVVVYAQEFQAEEKVPAILAAIIEIYNQITIEHIPGSMPKIRLPHSAAN